MLVAVKLAISEVVLDRLTNVQVRISNGRRNRNAGPEVPIEPPASPCPQRRSRVLLPDRSRRSRPRFETWGPPRRERPVCAKGLTPRPSQTRFRDHPGCTRSPRVDAARHRRRRDIQHGDDAIYQSLAARNEIRWRSTVGSMTLRSSDRPGWLRSPYTPKLFAADTTIS